MGVREREMDEGERLKGEIYVQKEAGEEELKRRVRGRE